jgi:hypothetical protein
MLASDRDQQASPLPTISDLLLSALPKLSWINTPN